MFVSGIKNTGTQEGVLKAIFGLGGHWNKEKDFMVHNSSNLKQSSIREIFALQTILGFEIWALDIEQAYFQSAER